MPSDRKEQDGVNSPVQILRGHRITATSTVRGDRSIEGTAVTKESPTVSVPLCTRNRVRTVAGGVPETTAHISPPAKTKRTLVKSRPMEDDSDGFVTPDDTPIIENISPRSRSKGRLHAKRKAASPTNVVPKVARCISERNLRANPVPQVTPPRSIADTPSFLLPSSSSSPDVGTSYEPERDPQCNAVFTLKMTPTKLAKMITVPKIRNLDIRPFVKPKNDQFAPTRGDAYWDFLHRSPCKQHHPTGGDPAVVAAVPTSNTVSAMATCPSVAESGPKRNPARVMKGRRIIPDSPSPAKVAKKHVHPKPIVLKPIPEAKPADPPKAVAAPTKSSQSKQPAPPKAVAAPTKASKSQQPAVPKAAASTSKKPNSQPAPSTQPVVNPKPKKPSKKKAAAKPAITPAAVSSKVQKPASKQQLPSVPKRNDKQLTASQRRFRKRYRNQERQYFDAFKFCRTDPATSTVSTNEAEFPVSFLKRPVRAANKRSRQNRSAQLEQTGNIFTLHESAANKKAIEDKEKLFKERSLHKPEVLTQYFHGLTKTKLSEVEEIAGTEGYLLSSTDTEKLKWKTTLQITERDAERLQSANGMSFGRPPVKVDNTKDAPVLKANGVPLPLYTARETAIPTNRIGFTSEQCQIELKKSKKVAKEREPVKTQAKKKSSKAKKASKAQSKLLRSSSRVQPVSFVKGPESREQTVPESVQSKPFDDLLYHIDASDYAWLERKGPSIKYAEFQQIMQIFEVDSYMKRCMFKVRDLELQWDRTDKKNNASIENDPCSICLTEDIDDGSVIVFCDGCDVAVHTSCYGISVVPEGSWLCDSCRDEHAFPLCYFCPVPNGAVHLTEDELHFVHTTCAIWHPFAIYMDLPKRKKLIARKYLYNAARYVPCYVCGIQYGVVAFCSMDGCGKPFHIGCADRCGFWMEEDMRNPAKTEYSIYCYEHSKVRANAYFLAKKTDNLVKIRDIDGRCDLLFEPSLEMFDELEKDFLAFAPRVNDDLFKKFDVGQVTEVFHYWKVKRFTHGRPLIDPCKIPASAFPRFSKEAKNPIDIPVTAHKPPLELDELKQWHAVQKYVKQSEKDDVDAVSAGVATLGLLEKGRARTQSKAARGNFAKLLKSTEAAANDSDDGARPKRRRTLDDHAIQTQEGDDDCVVLAESESTVVLADENLQDDESTPSASTAKRRSPKRPRINSADTSAKQLFDGMVATLGLNNKSKRNNKHFVVSTLSEADRIGFSCVPKVPSKKKVADAEANDNVPDANDVVIVEDPEPSVPTSHRHSTRNRHYNGEPVEKEPRLDDDLESPDGDQDPTREVDVEEVLENFINFVDPTTSVWAKW
uniref:PHD-type domain-containing protein n=1 Tax=Panagrellus redivivus TaxID=6233 RepID=A0A7E4V8N2_PANRE